MIYNSSFREKILFQTDYVKQLIAIAKRGPALYSDVVKLGKINTSNLVKHFDKEKKPRVEGSRNTCSSHREKSLLCGKQNEIKRKNVRKKVNTGSVVLCKTNVVGTSNRFEILSDKQDTDLVSLSDCVNNVIPRDHKIVGRVAHKSTENVSQTTRFELGPKTGVKNMDNDCALPSALADSKYDLGLTSISKKCQALRKAKSADFNRLFFRQNSAAFGFIPTAQLPDKIKDNSNAPPSEDVLDMHKKLQLDGRPNYRGLQLPVKSKLNYERFATYLDQYWDWLLPFYVKFGFPLDVDSKIQIDSDRINHKSATDFPSHVDTYIKEELSHSAMLGPFKSPPINLHVSPFLTREKSDSCKRRVIVDLSWPKGLAVNDATSIDCYDGLKFLLTFPSIDLITRRVMHCGRACKIAKIDISRAFKHVPIDPKDISYLGLFWKKFFIEKNLVFGFRHGSQNFQRLSDSIRFILAQENHFCCNYADDFLLIDSGSRCELAFQRLSSLLPELGFDISDHKTVSPSTVVTCLGIEINTETFTTSIPDEKLK